MAVDQVRVDLDPFQMPRHEDPRVQQFTRNRPKGERIHDRLMASALELERQITDIDGRTAGYSELYVGNQNPQIQLLL